MAITLDARTDTIINSILKSLGADNIRLAEAPSNAQIAGELRVTTAGAETEITVSNGHLWPNTGDVTIVDAPNTETLAYVQVRTNRGNKRPSHNGVGPAPNAILRLTPGVTVASAHTAPVPVFVPAFYHADVARAFDNGLLGSHDLLGLLRSLKEDLTPAVLTVDEDDATNAFSVDGSTAGAQGGGVAAVMLTEFNDASADDVVMFPAVTEEADNDYFAIGYDEPWGSVRLSYTTSPATDGTVVWEYWNGTVWATLTVVESAANVSNFYADGTISWTIPTDWATTTSTLMTASGTGRDTVQRYYIRARIATVFTTTNPVADQGQIGMGINGVMDVGAFIADAHIGDTVTMVTGTAIAEVGTVTSNTVDALMVLGTEFTVIIDVADTYQVNVVNYDSFIDELETSHSPPNYDSSNDRGTADTSPTPGALATLMVGSLVKLIEQYGGTVPANDEATGQLAREVDRSTRLTATAATGDTTITVADASLLLGFTTIIVGVTTATIERNNARRGGQGPNTILLTGALGGAGEAIGVVVAPSPRGTVETGRRHVAAAPHGFGRGFQAYLDAAILAVEGHTVPT